MKKYNVHWLLSSMNIFAFFLYLHINLGIINLDIYLAIFDPNVAPCSISWLNICGETGFQFSINCCWTENGIKVSSARRFLILLHKVFWEWRLERQVLCEDEAVFGVGMITSENVRHFLLFCSRCRMVWL